MKKRLHKFELDLNFGSDSPIGMDPKQAVNHDMNSEYFQYLEKWKPLPMPANGRIKKNIARACVVLS